MSLSKHPCQSQRHCFRTKKQGEMAKPKQGDVLSSRQRSIPSFFALATVGAKKKQAKVARSASPPAASPPRPSHVTPSQDASREEPPLTHPPKTEKDVERVDHTAKPTERRISPQRRDSYSTVVGSCSTDQEKATENATNVFGSGPIQFCETHHL